LQQSPTRERKRGEPRNAKAGKQKFIEQRVQEVKQNPLKPLNTKQKLYIELLQSKPIVIATGFAGTSKTYVPTVMAADSFKTGEINKIIITRPAISNSKSLGFFTGSHTEKMTVWLGPVVQILKDRLGVGAYEVALANSDIEFIPLETLKGNSFSDCWVLAEEAEDLTKEEVVKLVTRMGNNSTLVISGDIFQSELKGNSGLLWLSDFVKRQNLQDVFGFVEFNDTADIVRSNTVKRFLIALNRDEKEQQVANKQNTQRNK
jgi:phosphate starvation-inducible PhoH-like protein